MKQNIVVAGQETKTAKTGNTKYIIVSDNKKYEFYRNKADRTASVAYTGYANLNPMLGDTLAINVEETPESFQDTKTGKMVNYTKRRIMSFDGRVDATGTLPQATQAPPQAQTPQTGNMTLELRIDALEARVAFLENPPQNNLNDEVYADIDGKQTPVPS